MEKGPRGTGTWSRKYLELTAAAAAEEAGDGGEETENLSILKEEEEARDSLWSSSLMVSKTLGLLRLMTETNWGGQASLINLANREVAAIFKKWNLRFGILNEEKTKGITKKVIWFLFLWKRIFGCGDGSTTMGFYRESACPWCFHVFFFNDQDWFRISQSYCFYLVLF